MSEQNTIPQNNLPIYLQEYTVSVLGNLTSLDCSVSPKDEVGTIQYSTLGVIPSNKKDARVWDLKASGTLKPHDKDYIIHYDLSKVDYKGEVTFENELSGVITVCGRVISISKKNATWFPCEETKTVSIILDQSRWGFSIKKETPFSMDIQLDDDDSEIIIPYDCSSTNSTPSLYSTSKTTSFYIKGDNSKYLVILQLNDNQTWTFNSNKEVLVSNWGPSTGFTNWKIDDDIWLIATKGQADSIVYYVSAQRYTDSVNSGCTIIFPYVCYGTENTPPCYSTNKTTTFYIKSLQERIYQVALSSNINKTWDFASKEFISNKVVPLVNDWEPTTGFSNWKIDDYTWLIAIKGPNGSIVYYVSSQSYSDSFNSGCKFKTNCA